MRSNSLNDISVRDPVAFAQTWGIKIVTLDATVKAIDRQLMACGTGFKACMPYVCISNNYKQKFQMHNLQKNCHKA